MLTRADAIEAYTAAVETAGAAYDRAIGPARARMDKARRLARESGTTIPPEDVNAWLAAARRAEDLYQSIVAGPRADVDAVLHPEETTDDDH